MTKAAARILLFTFIGLFFALTLQAQTTEFTYQGSLSVSGAPASGNYDFEFALFDALSGTGQVGSTLTRNSVAVTNGVFAVKLDFGSQFPGANRFLEIHVRQSGGGSFTPLSPRQSVNSSPYSVKTLSAENATSAATATNAAQLGGIAAGQYVLTGDARLSDARNPLPGSASYIQNQNASPQASSNFNISGNGTADGNFTANRLISTVGTGTPPLSVTSTALVNNLNAQYLNGFGSSSFLQTTGGTLTGTLNLPVDGLQVGTNQIVTTIGRVGIGITPAPLNRFQVAEPVGGGRAIYGENTYSGNADGYGIYGRSVNNPGWGYGGNFVGGFIGVQGVADATSFAGGAAGVQGIVYGTAGDRIGVIGLADVSSGTTTAYGLYGTVVGPATTNYGIYAIASGAATNYAGYFNGNVQVNGTLSKSGGAFKIDHPLDPANKYLLHSFVESPDMKNIYDGNGTTDANGDATVTLPDWFGALNRDFRYQLTVIGQFAQAIISEEMKGNQFKIKTDKPAVKVSWQVTGIRKDRYAEENRIKVEEDKLPEDKGRCLYAPLCGGAKIDPGERVRKEERRKP